MNTKYLKMNTFTKYESRDMFVTFFRKKKEYHGFWNVVKQIRVHI